VDTILAAHNPSIKTGSPDGYLKPPVLANKVNGEATSEPRAAAKLFQAARKSRPAAGA
jgi:hypothetical protein